MSTAEPFWHGSIRRLVARLKAGFPAPSSNSTLESVEALQAIGALAQVVRDDVLLEETQSALAAISAEPAELPDDLRERTSALRGRVQAALARDLDVLAVCWYVALVLGLESSDDGAATRRDLADVRDVLDRRAFARLGSARNAPKVDLQDVLRTGSWAADVFALTENRRMFWWAQCLSARAHQTLGDVPARFACLLPIASSFLDVTDAGVRMCVEDEETRQFLVVGLLDSPRLIRELAGRDADAPGRLDVEDAVEACDVVLRAIRRFGAALDNSVLHFDALLLASELETNRAEPGPAMLERFEELLALWATVAQAAPQLETPLRERLRALSLVVLDRGLRQDLTNATQGPSARQACSLALRGLTTSGDSELAVGAALAFADHLLGAGYHDEAAPKYEALLGASEAKALLTLPEPIPGSQPRSLRGILHERLAEVYWRRGAQAAALGHAEQALLDSRSVGDLIGQARAYLAQACLLLGDDPLAANLKAAHALQCALDLRELAEQAYPAMALALAEQSTSSPELTQVFGGIGQDPSIGMTVALRGVADGNVSVAWFMAGAHPEPLLLLERTLASLVASEPLAEACQATLTLGLALRELGDPLRAEQAFRSVLNGTAAPLRVRVDCLHARALLYLHEHPFFSYFDAAPRVGLELAAQPPGRDSKNVLAAREMLAEAHNVLQRAPDVLLQARLCATALAAFEALPADDAACELWCDRATQLFREQRDWFKTDTRFIQSHADRNIVVELHQRLLARAKAWANLASKQAQRKSLVGAQRAWLAAIELYRTLEANSLAGRALAEEASLWRYLGRIGKEQASLALAIDLMRQPSVSYEPPSTEARLVPQLSFAGGEISFSGVDFRPCKHYGALPPIGVSAGSVDADMHLSLIDSYQAQGLGDKAEQVARSLLAGTSTQDDPTALMTRVALALTHLKVANTQAALELLEPVSAKVERRLVEAQSQIPAGSLEIDLSTNNMSMRASEGADLDEVMGSAMTIVATTMDLKGLLAVRVQSLFATGQAFVLGGRVEDGIARLRQCLELCKSYGAWSVAVEIHHFLGKLIATYNPALALDDLRAARTLVRAHGVVGDGFLHIRVSAALGAYFYKQGRLRQAVHHNRQALQMAESVRETLATQDLQAPLMALLSDVHEGLILSTLADPGRALEYSEAARSRALLDAVDVGNPPSTPPSASASEEEDLLRDQIEAAKLAQQKALRSAPRSAAAAAAAAALDSLRSRYEDLVIERSMREARSRFAEAARPDNSMEISRGLALLSERAGRQVVLLEFFVAETCTVAWLVSSKGVACERIEVTRRQLERRVATFREGVRAPFARLEWTDELFTLLLSPFGRALDDKLVAVVPHGPLHRLPFAALRSDGRFWVESCRSFYTPSASILIALGRRARATKTQLLALADADETLPFARLEAQRISATFAAGERRVLLGADATRRALLEHFGGASVLHVATHGNYNHRFPIFSSLELADDPLLLSDVMAIGSGPQLVVLSACYTGESRLTSGEEQVGLSAAFLRAGARTVLVSSWEAEDDSQATLMERFYDGAFLRQLTPIEALHQATLSLIQDGHGPRSWAGQVLIGSPVG